MGDKRKRDDGAGGRGQNPKRVKNKAKYQPRGNKSRRKVDTQTANGANAVPVAPRQRLPAVINVDADADADANADTAVQLEAAPLVTSSKLNGEDNKEVNDFFMIDTTPMDVEEVEQKKKSKSAGKKERKAAKEAATQPDGENKKNEKKEAKDLKEAQKAQRREEKEKLKQEKAEAKKGKKEKKGKEAKAKKVKETKKEAESSDSSSDSDSDSESGPEVEKKVVPKVKEPAPKVEEPAASEKQKKKKTTSDGKAKAASDKKPIPKDTNNEQGEEQEEGEEAQEGSTNKSRFIVFVGNLPYTANLESVTAHFAKISPISVRVATDKLDAKKCRGFGFVEFEQFDRMQTCLKLYHHSSFDDGKSPARKINVELTAGGGGKSKTRQTKLREKNQKLTEERTKLAKDDKKKKQDNNGTDQDGKYAGIHPSRMNMMR